MDALTHAVTHFSAQLAEAAPNEKVRVAGMIVRVRHHQSRPASHGLRRHRRPARHHRAGHLPSVWARVSELIQYDQIVLVDGAWMPQRRA